MEFSCQVEALHPFIHNILCIGSWVAPNAVCEFLKRKLLYQPEIQPRYLSGRTPEVPHHVTVSVHLLLLPFTTHEKRSFVLTHLKFNKVFLRDTNFNYDKIRPAVHLLSAQSSHSQCFSPPWTNIRQASSNLYPQLYALMYCDVSLHWQTNCPYHVAPVDVLTLAGYTWHWAARATNSSEENVFNQSAFQKVLVPLSRTLAHAQCMLDN